MTATEVDQLPKIELTFLYRTNTAKGEISYIWAEDRGAGKKRSYSADKKGQNVCPNAFVGAVYAMPQDPDGSIYGSRAKYVDRVQDCHEWLLIDRATNEEINAIKAVKRIKELDLFKQQLAPIRRAYATMNSLDRALVLAWIVKYLTTGVTGKEKQP